MQKINQLFQNLVNIFQKYTLVLASSLTMAITAIVLIEDKYISEATELILVKILITSALGISLFFGLYMFSQRYGKRYLFEAIGILLLIGFYFVLPPDKKQWNIVQIISIFSCAVLTHLFVAFAPFWNSKEEAPFWQYNKSLFISLVQTWIFVQVLIAGVLLAVVAVENLFNIDFSEKIYLELGALLSILGSTTIFLLFQIDGLKKMQAETPYPIVLKFFTQFILIPLLMLYGVILYLYMFKILINFNLPQGWISYMVLTYSIFGILALLLVHPLRNQMTKSWVFWFHKIFFYTLIPLVILLFIAINTRILEYGFTEARYFVFLTAVWLAGIVCYFLFFKKTHIKIIPISLFLILALSLILPYFNAFSVSVRSQEKDLQRIMIENKLLVNGKIDFKKEVADSVVNNIEDKFEFLSERFKYQSLKSYLSEDLQKSFKNKTVWSVEGLFLNLKTTNATHQSYYNFTLNYNVPFMDVSSYDFVIPFNQIQKGNVTIRKDVFSLRQSDDHPQFFKLTLNSQNTFDLTPQFKSYFEKLSQKEGQLDVDNLYFDFKLGNYQIRYICYSLSNRSLDGEISYGSYDGYFLIKILN